jgi:DNA-binding NarL/FixJ family response regulator
MAEDQKIRVLIADDHPMIRIGIRRTLENAQDIEVVGEAGDGSQVLKQVDQLQPDVLLLDYEMPRVNGIDVVANLRRKAVPVKVIILSAYDSISFVRPILSMGVSGYLSKQDVSDNMVAAIREVAAGAERWLSPTIVQEMSAWEKKTKGRREADGVVSVPSERR